MKICPKCSTQLPDDTAFCNNCGTPVANVPISSGAPSPADNIGAADSVTPSFQKSSDPAPDPFNSTPLTPPTPPTDNTGAAAPRKKMNTTTLIIICAAAAAVLLLIIILLIASAAGAYKKPVNNLIKLANSKSTKVSSYLDCVSPAYVGDTYDSAMKLLKGGDAKEELDDAINDGFEEIFDGFEDDYGKNWKLSVEYKKNKKLSDRKLEDLQDSWDDLSKTLKNMDLDDDEIWENLADSLDDEYDTELDPDKAIDLAEKFIDEVGDTKITAAYEVKAKITVKGSDGEDDETVEFNVVKANGKWIIDPLSFSFDGVSFSSLLNQLQYQMY